MANVTFKVDTDRLGIDANNMMDDIRCIMSDIEDINSQVNTLGKMWKGEANQALTESFNQAHGWMLEVLKSYEKIINTLMEDKEKYDICDRNVTDVVSKI